MATVFQHLAVFTSQQVPAFDPIEQDVFNAKAKPFVPQATNGHLSKAADAFRETQKHFLKIGRDRIRARFG